MISVAKHYKRLIVLEKLAALGTRKNILGNWASDQELYSIWRRRVVVAEKYSHNSGVSWIRKSKENAILAELIYRTYCEVFPHNASLKKPITPYQLYELYLVLYLRVQNKSEFSTNRIYHLLRAIASNELKVNCKCKTCSTIIVDDINDINLHCGLCRYLARKKRVESSSQSQHNQAVVGLSDKSVSAHSSGVKTANDMVRKVG